MPSTLHPTDRIYNFSAGPCTLPLAALEQARDELTNYQHTGMSLIEMSHRSTPVVSVFEEAQSLVRDLLAVPASHHILFMGGGATFQFAMTAMNLLHNNKSADFVHSGAWAKKAIDDANKVGQARLIFDGSESHFTTLPDPTTVTCHEDAAYLHLTSNETIGGVQWKTFPTVDKPIVADMSSDILSQPVAWEKFGLVYAGAQKNIGPAGVALVVLRDDMLKQCPGDLPGYLNYAGHVKGESMLNTPPVFQVYMIKLVLEWLKGQGGLPWAQQMAQQRSELIYRAIAQHAGFYTCPVDERYRSTMNVVFRLPTEALEDAFVKQAQAQGMSGLKGHRSVGGCRVSLYNAMPLEGAQALASFMADFAQQAG